MDLLIVRHAIAARQEDWAQPDSERPLTAKGRKRMKRNTAGIVVAFPQLERIATSPFVRAAQTAAVLRKAYGNVEVEELPALASGGARNQILAWLAERKEQRIALVGHEPDLGQLAAWLVTGQTKSALEMRKGGACLLTFAGVPAAGKAELRWFLPPSLLRRLAR